MRVLREAMNVAESRWSNSDKLWRVLLVVSVVVLLTIGLVTLLVVLSFKLLGNLSIPVNRRNTGLYIPSVRRRL